MRTSKTWENRTAGKERLPQSQRWIISFGESDPNAPEIPGRGVSVPVTRGADGARQLRISGGSTSNPYFASDSSCAVIFDGLLFNRTKVTTDIPVDLEREANPAELILNAYKQLGRDIVHELRGVFAVIIWDVRRDLLLGFPDCLGAFPLFYASTARQLLFSASVDALVQHPRVSREINRAVLVQFLSSRWGNIDETYYTSVKRVPPGHCLSFENGRQDVHRYWDPISLDHPIEWIRDDELHQFDECFDVAIESCMQVGPVSIFLSGGLDSVSVASVASDILRKKDLPAPLALSLVFPHPDCDEEEIQKGVAENLGLPQILTRFDDVVGSKGLLSTALELCSNWPVPPLTMWKSGYYYLASEAYLRGYRTILTGHGGDEWLTVNPAYAADLIRDFRLLGLYRLHRNSMRSYNLSRPANLRYLLWTSGLRLLLGAYLPRVLHDRVRSYRSEKIKRLTPAWAAPDPELRREINERIDALVEESIRKPVPPRGHGFYFETFADTHVRSVASLEMEEDFELGRRLGIWILKPFLNADLITLLARFPPELLQRGGREKGLVRETLARRFPGLRFENQRKVVVMWLLKSVLCNEGPRIWNQMHGTRALAELGVVDGAVMEDIFRKLVESDNLAQNYRIWRLLGLESWTRPRV